MFSRALSDQGLDDNPIWLRVVPAVGAALLAVPVAAQRGFDPVAIALVAVIFAVTVLDVVDLMPKLLLKVVVLVAIYALLRFDVDDDLAPFYLVALCAIGAALSTPRSSTVLTLASVGVLALAASPVDAKLLDVFVWSLGITLGWVGGLGLHAQLRLTSELHAAQANLAERAATDERQRIAREIHDVIAHSLTVTMLHLTGARLALESGAPDEAAEALTEAERLGRQSLGDIRRTVGLLGSSGATDAPLPSASDIAALVRGFREAGMAVVLRATGDLTRVSMATGLGLYRIVQEALSNVGRHAQGATAEVEVEVGDADVRLLVRNNAVAAARVPVRTASDGGGGMGIDGMRERALLLGGDLTAGPTADGGWQVAVAVPLDAP